MDGGFFLQYMPLTKAILAFKSIRSEPGSDYAHTKQQTILLTEKTVWSIGGN